MQRNKGITLVALVITITVLLILASVATYSGLNVVNSSKLTAFTTELKIMQTQVNAIYEEDREKQIGEEIAGDIQTQANKVFTELESGITSQDGYRYWNQDLIKELGIEGVEQDFFVNLKERSVVSYQGLKFEGKTYYTLSQVPNGLYNVGYENPNGGKPTFKLSQEKLSDNKWKIAISNIQYEEGYINKWQVQYQLEGKETWNTTKDLSFVVSKPGSYHIILMNGEVKSDEQIILIGSSWKDKININTPNLMEGMTAVYWDNNNQEKILTSANTEAEWNNWYDYVVGDNATDTKTSKWANAKTNDGSYWVWVPRYEYKILSGEGTSNAGPIEVKFIPTTQTTADTGYKIHPAFTDGTSNNFMNGEWDKELPGIWVAKYESSHSDATASSEGSSNTLKVVPGVQSWGNTSIADMYTTAYNYDRSKESHMMKDSEWGAVVYLAHSQYGRNGHEIDFNNSSDYITGNGGGSANASSAIGVTNSYNTTKGAQASTTGNIYGIYDLSGGAWDRTASYITNGMPNLSASGLTNNENQFVVTTVANTEGYKTLSTKYATVYPYNSSSDTNTDNYNTYKSLNYGYGNAILETSSDASDSEDAWFGNYTEYFNGWAEFMIRGGCSTGNNNYRGIFTFAPEGGGKTDSRTFRVVLAGM